MKEKLLVIMLSTLILSPYFISANEGKKENVGYRNSYNLYTKTIFFFGGKRIHDNFTTPPDCKKIGVSARVGQYFTGDAGILIKSKNYSRDAHHTLWGTGYYIFGKFVYPQLRVFYDRWFVPGEQIVEIGGWGFGEVTFWVNETS
ncbi:MAG: hypothetical protein J7L58_07115 [Thermoplasmata archaeon]|nr:hypothetical protein [Thermoplasmata archaeon]